MATTSPSPSQSNNSTDTGLSQPPAATTAPTARLHRIDGPKTLRGLNKPKCIQCGNVARSRCPFQSCKSCCSKAQNPCYIHVLIQSATVPEKASSAGSPKVDEPSKEFSPTGLSHRVPSYRQLSNQFSQFNNLNIQPSRKPLTRKEAFDINEWRFAKLKEYRERNLEIENDGFDCYIENINLLEEVLSREEHEQVEPTDSDTTIATETEENNEVVVSPLKLRLKSNSAKSFNSKERLRDIIRRGLWKFHNIELNDGGYDVHEFVSQKKKAKTLRYERASTLNDLMDKINKARTVEDLQACMELKFQLFKEVPNKHQMEGNHNKPSNETATDVGTPSPQPSLSTVVDSGGVSCCLMGGCCVVFGVASGAFPWWGRLCLVGVGVLVGAAEDIVVRPWFADSALLRWLRVRLWCLFLGWFGACATGWCVMVVCCGGAAAGS